MQPAPFRLPHSGLTVPHTGYTVTAYKGHTTHDGVAFTATLRLHDTIIGTIENEGCGGPDTFYPSDANGYREQVDALETFASGCTDANGDTPTLEFVLGDLVTEYETRRDIARAAKHGTILMRLMQDHEGSDGPMGRPSEAAVTEATPSMAANRDRLRSQLLAHPRLAPDALAWWQIWDADTGHWSDVTARPAHIPADQAAHTDGGAS